jgi:tetratricopeptide (TPR) repeat protein
LQHARSADALQNRANVLFEMKRFTDALAGYDKALALRPDDPRLISNRGNTLCELNRPAEAVAAFDRALKLKPGDPDVLNTRGNALLTLNRASDALTCYDRALAVRPRDAQTLTTAATRSPTCGGRTTRWRATIAPSPLRQITPRRTGTRA